MLNRAKGWSAILNRVDQVSLCRSQLRKDLEMKYIHVNICRKNIRKGNQQYNNPEAGVTGIFENNNEASVAVMKRATGRIVKAKVREAKGEGCKV